MAKDKTGKEIPAEAFEGDYTDPAKRAEVDWSYDPGYLRRRKAFAEEMRERLRCKRRTAS